MSPRANIYLQCVFGTGIFLLVSGLTEFSTANLPQFFAYLSAAMLSATWNFKVPGLPVTYSAMFAIALVQEELYAPVWRKIVRHSVLYHLTSGLIGALMIVASRFWGWQSGLLMVPLLYLTYRFYGLYLAKRDGEAVL